MNAAEHYTTRYLEPKDLDQYNALLRYTFQVTEEELTATGWKDDEIKQSKFPVLERIEGREEAVERLDDVLFHKIPYISDYI